MELKADIPIVFIKILLSLLAICICVNQVSLVPLPQNKQQTSNLNASEQNVMLRNMMSRLRKIETSRNQTNNNYNIRNAKNPSITFSDSREKCGDVFCVEVEDYPKDLINSLNLEKFQYFFGDDFVDNVSLRFDNDENGLCGSRRRLIYPQRGKNAHDIDRVIINQDGRYRQGISVEECIYAGSKCDYSEHFPLGIYARCKQHYSYRNLVSLGDNNQPVVENFQFPSCCKCALTSGYTSRVGEDIYEDRSERLILV